MPNLTIALTKNTSAIGATYLKARTATGARAMTASTAPAFQFSPYSYACCLGAIEETYNKDLPLAIMIYLKNKNSLQMHVLPEGRT